MRTYCRPSFLGVGPPKTGTTWLYQTLVQHPDVELPKDKEVRYLWERVFLGKDTYRKKLFSKHFHYRGKRRLLKRRVRMHLRNVARLRVDKSVWWDLRYFFLRHSDRWYESIFSADKISGDITPRYCELPEEEVQRIAGVFPQLKVLISLRDPVDREWSRAKMNLCRKKKRTVQQVTDEEFKAHFDAELLNSDYCQLVQRWRKHLGDDRVLVFFYDELVELPGPLYEKICGFLGIQPDAQQFQQLSKPVNEGVKARIPEHLQAYLYDKFKTQMRSFAEFYRQADYPRRWLQRYPDVPVAHD